MLFKKIILFYLAFTSCFAASSEKLSKNHMALKLGNNGLKTILAEVVEHYRGSNERSIIVLPSESFTGTVQKEMINENPIIRKLKNFVEININENLNFHVKWTPITIEAKLAEKNIEIETFGKGKNFDTTFKLDIEELVIKGSKIEFCEYEKKDKTCNSVNGLYGRFDNYEIRLKDGELIQTLIKTNIRVRDGIVKIDFDKLVSNLISQKSKIDKMDMSRFQMNTEAPKFWLNFESFAMPPPVLIFNGNRIEIETKEIGDALLQEREFLANLLTGFAGEFVAKDLVNLFNNKIISKIDEIKTTYQLIDYDKYKQNSKRFLELMDKSTKEALLFLKNEHSGYPENDFLGVISNIFRRTIHQVKSDLVFNEMNTIDAQDLVAYFDTDLVVNDKKIQVGSKVWNGRKKFGKINFEKIEFDYDFALAISEPLINTFAKTAVNTGLVNEVFQELIAMDGVKIEDLNFHVISNQDGCTFDRLKVVTNLRVKMSELKRNSWMDHISFKLGEYLESEWGGDWNPLPKEQDLYFPLEIDFIVSLRNDDGKTTIYLNSESPFGGGEFRNTFNYPIKNMSGMVQDALLEKLKSTLEPHLDRTHGIDITDYVNAIPGIELVPNHLLLSERGHIVLTFDINKIDLKKLGRLGVKKD